MASPRRPIDGSTPGTDSPSGGGHRWIVPLRTHPLPAAVNDNRRPLGRVVIGLGVLATALIALCWAILSGAMLS